MATASCLLLLFEGALKLKKGGYWQGLTGRYWPEADLHLKRPLRNSPWIANNFTIIGVVEIPVPFPRKAHESIADTTGQRGCGLARKTDRKRRFA